MSKVYIIEDNSIDFQVLQSAFELCNFTGEIFQFTDASSALENLKQLVEDNEFSKLPNLIITDINMPAMDGFEFCRTLMGDENLVVIPVVMMSNSTSPNDIRKAYQAGAKSILSKRIDFDVQVRDVKTLIEFWLSGVVQSYHT